MAVRDDVPYTWSEFSNGLIYGMNGMEAPIRWDGLTAAPEAMGMATPATAPAVAGSGTGTITGTIYARVRYKDRFGFFSNLSAASTVVTIGTAKTITAATNASPIVITSTSHGYSNGITVRITNVAGNIAANGLRKVASVTTHTFALTDIDDVNVSGSGEYIGGGTSRQGVSSVDYSSIPVPSGTNATEKQLLRTKHGDANTYYLDVVTTNLAATTISSTNADSALTTTVSLVDIDGDDLADVNDQPPNTKAVVLPHLNRLWALVDIVYKKGAVVVTNSSTTVTGIGTDWVTEMAGRLFFLKGATAQYTISSVNESAQTLVLTAAFAGTTNAYANYAIRPTFGERNLVYYTEANLPESWPPLNAISVPDDTSQGELTGAIPYNSFLYFMAERKAWKFTGHNDPGKDGRIFPGFARGLLNQHCWQVTDGVAYIMDRSGIYSYSGIEVDDSSQAIRDLWRVSTQSKYRINWDRADLFRSAIYPDERVIRWFVSLTGPMPRHAICLHYSSGAVWLEERPYPVAAAVLGVVRGRQQPLVGANAGRWFADGRSTMDGPLPGSWTTRGTVTSAGPTWIVDSAAVFPSAGILGTPFDIVAGKGSGQRRLITSISTTRINIDYRWLITPDTTSVYQMGGVKWQMQTGWLQWSDPPKTPDREQQRAVELLYAPTDAASTMELAIYQDQSEDAVEWKGTLSASGGDGFSVVDGADHLGIDTTRESGLVRREMPGSRETRANGNRFNSFKISGVTNQDVIRLHRLTVLGARGKGG